jgi:hypothetical protein
VVPADVTSPHHVVVLEQRAGVGSGWERHRGGRPRSGMWSLTCRRYRALCLAVWGRGGLTVHEALQHSCVAGATGCPRRAHSSELVVSARAPEREQMRKEPRAESLEPAPAVGTSNLSGGQGVAGSNPVVPTADRAVSYATGCRPESSSTCGNPDSNDLQWSRYRSSFDHALST